MTRKKSNNNGRNTTHGSERTFYDYIAACSQAKHLFNLYLSQWSHADHFRPSRLFYIQYPNFSIECTTCFDFNFDWNQLSGLYNYLTKEAGLRMKQVLKSKFVEKCEVLRLAVKWKYAGFCHSTFDQQSNID